jgi:hypothetical protein
MKNVFRNASANYTIDSAGLIRPKQTHTEAKRLRLRAWYEAFCHTFVARMRNYWTQFNNYPLVKNHFYKLSLAIVAVLFLLKSNVSVQLSKASGPESSKQTVAVDAQQGSMLGSSVAQRPVPTEIKPTNTAQRSDMPFMKDAEVRSYIKRFDKIAREEEAKYGIPRAITLGCAIVMSHAGTLYHVKDTYNHFARACGQATNYPGIIGEENYDGLCLYKFENAWASFRLNSMQLSKGVYQVLAGAHIDNTHIWLLQMQMNGYFKHYGSASAVQTVIDTYGLAQDKI